MLKNSKILIYALRTFASYRIALIILTFYGLNLLPTWDLNLNAYLYPSFKNYYWGHWANWDGGYFLNIAEAGYILTRTPFFPFYPVLIRALMFLGFNTFWSGFIISQISTILIIFFFYKLANLDYKENLSKKIVFLLLAFPTSFYLVATYSEGLFLALTAAAFYFARKNKWLTASILAGLSAATRLIGVSVIISIFAEYFFTQTPRFKISYLYDNLLKRLAVYAILFQFAIYLIIHLKLINDWLIVGALSTLSVNSYIPIWVFLIFVILKSIFKFFNYKKIITFNTFYLGLSLIPLLLYMSHLYLLLGDPLAFLKGQENWGRHFTFPVDTVVNHFQVISSHFLKTGYQDQLLLEFFSFLILAIFFVIGLYKLRFSYLIYFALSIILPLCSGKLMSMPRIALVVFPMYIVIAQIKNKIFQDFWIFFSLISLGLLSVLFFNSFWVA